MTLAIVISVFAGIVIGLRFTVLMTVPVVALAMAAAAGVAINAGHHMNFVIMLAVLSGAGVQVGYLCGSLAAFLSKDAPALAAEARPQRQPVKSYRLAAK